MKKFGKLIVLLAITVSLVLSMAVTVSAASRGKATGTPPPTAQSSVFSGALGGALKGAIVGGICALISSIFRPKKKKDGKGKDQTPPETPGGQATPPNLNEMKTVPVIVPKTEPKSQGAFLFCLDGVLKGRSYPVGSTPLIIGRLPNCGIQYPDDTRGVSRNHCQVVLQGSTLFITDLESSYGTYVENRGRLGSNKPVALHDGEIFCIGDKKNAFKVKIG